MLRDGNRLRALAEINTNDIAVRGGWQTPCARDPLPAGVRLRYQSRYDSSCAEAGATLLDGSGPPVWQRPRAGHRRGPACSCRKPC